MQAVLVFVALFSTFTLSTLALAAKEGDPLSGREELVIGRQYDHLNYFWTSKRGGEENSTFLDIAQHFADKQGKEVKIHFYHDRNDLLKAVVEGDVDLAMGYAQTKDATSYFSYSKPIFNVRSVIWLHRAELRDKDENSLSWGCVRGSFYCYVMEERGLTNIASFNSHRVMMQAIATGEIDAIYTDVITAEQYLSVRTPGEWVGDLEYVNTLPSYPASILTSKDRPQLHQDLVDYVESIQASLNRNQRSLVDVLGQEMMLKALKLEYGHSTIRYSFEKNMRPFSYESSGERVGYIHDLMSMLSRKSGVVFEYVAPSDATPLEMLKNGEIDLLPGYAEDTDSSLVFTKSFGQVYWKLVESNNKSGNDRVAILDRSDRIVMRKAEQVFDTLPIIYQDLDKLLIDIKQGKIDYAYIPSYVVDFHAYGSNDDAFNVVLSPTVKSLSVDMGFTLSSQSSLLQRIMNDVLKQVSSNEIEMLQLKHHQVVAQYGYDKSNIAVIALSILSLFLIVVIVIQRRANRLSQSLLNADKQVKENSERLQWLRDLLDRLPSMIAIYDEDGALVMSNKAFNQHGMECKSFKKGHCLLKNKTYKQDNMEHLVCKCKFSRRYLRVIENQISGMHDDGRYKMMVYDDYTALEKQKDELKASNEKALRAIHSRDLFLATVSHELRTPIAAMIGLMELMSAKVESEENVELLTNAQLSATRLRLLVNDILDISKIKANQFHLDVRNGNVYSELAPLLRTYESNADVKHLNFVLDWIPTVYVKAKLDWLRVTQIINNLLSNAVKFTHHGEVRVKVELNNSQLVVVVSDTGCGMNPDQLSNLFTPFAQGDVSITRKYGGTGLGMTIVKSIVDMMSGTLEVTSSEGVGTSMTVTLPVSQSSVFEIEEMCAYSEDLQVSAWLKAWGVESKEQTEAIQVSGGWKNIYPDLILDALQKSNNQQLVDPVVRQFVGHVLVVDDDPINRLLFSKQFAKLGIQPVIKNDGVEAYQYIQEHIDKLNLVITDCHMPNLDGYELTRKIRQDPISTHLPVVGCTAEDSKIVVEKAESAGMCSVLYKPYSLEELGETLSNYLSLEVTPSTSESSAENEDFKWLEEHQPSEQLEMMTVISQSLTQELKLIQQGEELKSVVHRLKGSAALLELHTLTELAKTWESLHEQQVEPDTQGLISELTRLIDVYQTWLDRL